MSNRNKNEETSIRVQLDSVISKYLDTYSYSVLEFLTEVIPICERSLHHKAGITDINDSNYDLGVRIKYMDATLLGFLTEFDLDLVVSSLIAQLRNYAENILDNEDYKLLYLDLASLLNTNY